MIEKDFEDILCRYPSLIEEGLTLIGRQVSVSGKFVDLLFEDENGIKLIVELKRGPVKREHISQLLDYEGHFLSDDDPDVRVMIIGNRVPMNFRKALDHHGIEWKEIAITKLVEFLKHKNDMDLLEKFREEEKSEVSITIKSNENNRKRVTSINTRHNKLPQLNHA